MHSAHARVRTTCKDQSIVDSGASTADPSALRDLLPFAAQLGIELLEAGPDLVRGSLAWAPERTTAGDVMHGGAMMALADTCGGLCAFLNLPEGSSGTATVESKTNFMRAVRDGTVTAITRPLHRGRTLIVVESELRRDDGKLAAKVTQTQIFH
jgi:1,4-dihydroxy-2-naphthoyl-CoA hydrolase